MQREKLSDAVKRLREAQNWSLEDVRKNCHKKLATSYLWRIEQGDVQPDVISVGKIEALAEGLRVPANELFDIAREVTRIGPLLETEMLGYFRELNARRQQDLVRLAQMYFEEQAVDGHVNGNIEPVPAERIVSKRPIELTDESKTQYKRRKAVK